MHRLDRFQRSKHPASIDDLAALEGIVIEEADHMLGTSSAARTQEMDSRGTGPAGTENQHLVRTVREPLHGAAQQVEGKPGGDEEVKQQDREQQRNRPRNPATVK